MIQLVLVDDHKLFRDGLKLILSSQDDITVIAEFGSGKQFIHSLVDCMPDVVLMDIELGEMNGIDATREALKLQPELKILALSSHGDEVFYHHMINAGARGFLIKECSSSELVEAVRKIAEGENYFSQELLRKIIYNLGPEGLHLPDPVLVQAKLSSREIEVLRLVCEGKTNAEIAEALFLSQRTVEGHRANILKKTNSKNTTALIMFAMKSGLVTN
jgi:DNA-binding NarL/FixJ family response regulator